MKLSNLVLDPSKLQTHGKYISAEEAYDELKRGAPATHGRIKAIASEAWSAYRYAWYVIRGRFSEGEAAIATNSHYAYWYARDIIKGRFPEGEAAIAMDSYYVYMYARYT